jgi:hypothetical protein
MRETRSSDARRCCAHILCALVSRLRAREDRFVSRPSANELARWFEHAGRALCRAPDDGRSIDWRSLDDRFTLVVRFDASAIRASL